MAIPRLPEHVDGNFPSNGQGDINGPAIIRSLVQYFKVAWFDKLEPETGGEFGNVFLHDTFQSNLSVQCQVGLIIELVYGI